jgi:hypothetical protein
LGTLTAVEVVRADERRFTAGDIDPVGECFLLDFGLESFAL